jgi:hypothetical protein
MTVTSEHKQELLLIGETWMPAIAGTVRDILDPATGEVIAQVADAGQADVDAAVAQARAVFDDGAWPGLPGEQRARILWRIADLIEEHADELARLETRDQGQPLSISAGFSVPMAAEVFRYYAGWCTKIEGTSGPVTTPDVLHYTRREPVGVAALITPWNFPLMIAAWKLAPALAAGNSVIIKPSELTPLITIRLARFCIHAVPVFVGSYLAVWATAGTAVYAVDRPHGPVAAGVTWIVAGAYEITPLKRQFRRRCRDSAGSGFGYGLCCTGSSIGLMAMLVAVGVMSIPWMALITVMVLAQKLLPARAAIDAPLALAITGLGIVIILAPSSVPGLTPPM